MNFYKKELSYIHPGIQNCHNIENLVELYKLDIIYTTLLGKKLFERYFQQNV